MINTFLRILDHILYRHALRAFKRGKMPGTLQTALKEEKQLVAENLDTPDLQLKGKSQTVAAQSSNERRNVYPFW